ncbi:MAG: ABC-F family ATP-binding cassette domain-containing protein [Micrococcaceae bacterium]
MPTTPVPASLFPARHRAQLTAAEVSVFRGGSPVLQQVSLSITPQSRIAVVGENGRGKTTLLHALAGLLEPDAGTVQRVGTLDLVEQEMSALEGRTVGDVVTDIIASPLSALAELDDAAAALADVTTGADVDVMNRYTRALERAEALDAWDAERRVQLALEALNAETDMARTLTELSVGQRYRVRLACLLGVQEDFLLLDEPTNHLDRSGLAFLTQQLRARRGGIVLVSHDRALLRDVAETVIDLDPTPDGAPRVYGDGYEQYRSGRLSEREQWVQEFERQQQEHLELQESLSTAQNRLVSHWRPEKGTGKHTRATRAGATVKNVRRRQEELDAHRITVPVPPLQFRFPELRGRAGTLLAVEDVMVEQRLASPVSLELARRGRLVVTGPNGAGKSTLLDVLAGTLSPDAGTVRRSADAQLGILRQESSLPLERRVNQLYADHTESLVAAGALRESQVIGLGKLGLLRSYEIGMRVGELSMGQRRRVGLALTLAARPQVLLLDEPTNHLSIALVDELTEGLQSTEAAVVLATHDRQLLRDTTDWPHLELGASVRGQLR